MERKYMDENGNDDIHPDEFFRRAKIGVHRNLHKAEKLDFPSLTD